VRSDRVVAVLLDMGGVLIPEVPDYDRAGRDRSLLDGLRGLGVAEPASFAIATGRRVREAYNALAASCRQPVLDDVLADVAPDVRRLCLRAFAREAAQPPFSHAREVVTQLASHYRMGLVSNTVLPGDHHPRNLARAGILAHLGAALFSADFGIRKPDPAMLRCVLRALGVEPRQAVFVGDKIRTDVLAARRAGVRSIWLRQGGADWGSERPDFVIRDLRELPFVLRSL
jgi:HAD superfamily hydrolase (TIGR01509 family)